jgi:uncharacterized protein
MHKQDLEDCAETVAEYEEAEATRLAQLRGVQQQMAALEVQKFQLRAVKVREWASAVVQQKGAAISAEVVSEAEKARAKARAAATDTKAVKSDRKQVGANGQIDEGPQRCIADTKKGLQCKAHTRHGEYCWTHLIQRRGVRIKKSTIPQAGKGLYAARDYQKGEVVARYTGDLIPLDHDGGFAGSSYVLELSQVVGIDAARTNTAEGRMLNDARGSGMKTNTRFCCNQSAKTATIKATTGIKKGQELFVSYGRAFWSKGGARGDKSAVPAVTPIVVPVVGQAVVPTTVPATVLAIVPAVVPVAVPAEVRAARPAIVPSPVPTVAPTGARIPTVVPAAAEATTRVRTAVPTTAKVSKNIPTRIPTVIPTGKRVSTRAPAWIPAGRSTTAREGGRVPTIAPVVTAATKRKTHFEAATGSTRTQPIVINTIRSKLNCYTATNVITHIRKR